MNLSEILKQFKYISPDASYAERSKREILMSPRTAPVARPRISWVLGIFETGVALVLAGFFVILITGGFSNSSLSPVQFSVIDPQGLRAEAQAIDMQIQLANLNYPYPESSNAAASPSVTAPLNTGSKIQPMPGIVAPLATGTATSTGTSTLSIDEALQQLSQ